MRGPGRDAHVFHPQLLEGVRRGCPAHQRVRPGRLQAEERSLDLGTCRVSTVPQGERGALDAHAHRWGRAQGPTRAHLKRPGDYQRHLLLEIDLPCRRDAESRVPLAALHRVARGRGDDGLPRVVLQRGPARVREVRRRRRAARRRPRERLLPRGLAGEARSQSLECPPHANDGTRGQRGTAFAALVPLRCLAVERAPTPDVSLARRTDPRQLLIGPSGSCRVSMQAIHRQRCRAGPHCRPLFPNPALPSWSAPVAASFGPNRTRPLREKGECHTHSWAGAGCRGER